MPGADRAGLRLVHKGITYDVGTGLRVGGALADSRSREAWPDEATARAAMRREIGLIRDDLNCTAIALFGSDPGRLLDAAAVRS